MPEKEVVVNYKRIIYLTADDNAENFSELVNIFSQQVKLADISPEDISFKEKNLIKPSKRVLSKRLLLFFIYNLPFFGMSFALAELAGIISLSDELDITFFKSSETEEEKLTSTKDSQGSNINSISLKYWLEESVQILPYSSVPKTLIFPLGPPIPNKIYYQHPLTDKKNHYIPAESYYSTLQEEKELELISILCDLGATKIEIYEEENQSKDVTLKAQGKIKSIGGIEGNISKETEKSQSKKGEFTYEGKPWHPNLKDEFDSSKYSWYAQERIWRLIVYGRLTNGQLSANIELTTNLSSEEKIGISLVEGLLKEIGGVDASALVSNLMTKKRRFFVEFAGKEESKSAKGKK
ncbi:hypothetical protein [Laspinema olomoucense]|uniref:Uncharacterized protein n=1 Tax=Laspinema olomoucense D3b TaxID=2953688 RepID=A0ABT2N8B3_9CYAN|nr:hypothetical protein [Laspinema sp. D3b]MCT7977615.1 hypothetical protein [Laspinema sp. D3b]